MDDVRDLVIDYTVEEMDSDVAGGEAQKQMYYDITATLKGQMIGNMEFSAYFAPANPKEIHPRMTRLRDSTNKDIIFVEAVFVNEQYRKLGIGQLLYKKFGEIYNQYYQGWPVGRYYVNPVAEYSFRKAVSLGWISETAVTENYVYRDRYDRGLKNMHVDDTWNELNNKLPDQYKGPDVWAKRKS